MKYMSRIIMIAFFFYAVGDSVARIGTLSSPQRVQSGWGIFIFVMALAGILAIGFFAGKEHEKEKQ